MKAAFEVAIAGVATVLWITTGDFDESIWGVGIESGTWGGYVIKTAVFVADEVLCDYELGAKTVV